MRMPHNILACALAALMLGTLAAPAHAQMPGSAGATGFQPMFRDKRPPKPKEEAPPALPGATPGRGAAPAEHAATDMSPNDALFDAINRGDIASARDALGRGADLNAQNLLGMTPLELSVDLSRNDITFLLLSMRGGEATATAAGGPPGFDFRKPQPQRAEPAAAKVSAKPAAPKLAVTAKVAPKRAPQPAPQEFAGRTDPGTPDPQAGFLGFGRTAQ